MQFQPSVSTGGQFFGLVRHDLSPKPPYGAVKNLNALLSDRSPAAASHFRPGNLDYSLAVSPVMEYREPGSGKVVNYDRTRYVHQLLLQKRNGDSYLILWHEISDEDGSVTPHRVVTPPAMPTRITLPPSIKSAVLYVPNDSATGRPISLREGQIRLDVPDKLVVLRLRHTFEVPGAEARIDPGKVPAGAR